MQPAPGQASAESASHSRKILIVLACVVISAPLLGWVFWGMFIGFEATPTAADRTLVLNTEDLRAVAPDLPDQPGTLTRTEYLDGSWTLEYEYETDELYVYSSVSEERSERDARAMYMGMAAAVPIIVGLEEGAQMVDRDELFQWGDQSTAKELLFEGESTGIAIYGRRGRKVINATVGGWLFEDREQVDMVFSPWLQRVGS